MWLTFTTVSVLSFMFLRESETAIKSASSCQIKRYNGSCLPLEAKLIHRDCEPSKPSKTIRGNSVPIGSPRELKYNKSANAISWKPNLVKTEDIGFFMLKISFEEDKNKSSKLLLFDFTNISLSGMDHDTTVTLPINIYFPANKVLSGLEFLVWALPKTRLSECPGNKTRPALKYSPPAENWVNLDKAFEQLIRDANNCMCNTKVTFSVRSDGDRRNIIIIMTVKNLPSRGKIDVKLESSIELSTPRIFTVRGSSNGEKIIKNITEPTPKAGYYRVLSDVKCPPEYEKFVRCDGPYMQKSDWLAQFPGPDYALPETTNVVSASNSAVPASVVTLKSPTFPSTEEFHMSVVSLKSPTFPSTEEFIMLAVGAAVGIVLLVIVVVIVVCKVRSYFKSNPEQKSRLLSLYRVESTNTITEGTGCGNYETIAILYIEDSLEFADAVRMFQNLLHECGMKTILVDVNGVPAIRQNWADFSEKLINDHNKFIFVFSPGLYLKCHQAKYGSSGVLPDERAFCWNDIALPAVVIHLLTVKIFQAPRSRITTYVVSISADDVPTQIEAFLQDHCVVNNGFVYQLVQTMSGATLPSIDKGALRSLLRHLRSNREHFARENENGHFEEIIRKFLRSVYKVSVPSTKKNRGWYGPPVMHMRPII